MAFGTNTLTLLIKAKDEASKTLDNVRTKLKSHASNFERAGRSMMVASAAMTAGLGLAITKAASFQQQMAQVSTMLNQQSMKYMPQYEKSIKKMSMEFGESTGTLADGLYNILSASIPAEKAISVLDASVRAAKAGLTDTGTAADAITTIINAYGLEADRAADVSDLLFSIVKRGKLTFADLAPNIGKVAAMSAKAGLSMEELGATIATLTRSGIRTEEAMTAVRGMLNGMLKPADEAAAAFEDKLGVAMDTTTLRAEGMIGILKRMKTAGLTPEEISKMFPNVRALTGVVAAMGDLEGAMYDYNIMTERAGSTQEAFSKNTQITAEQAKRLWQSINVLVLEIGTQLLPYVEKMMQHIMNLVNRFVSLDDTTKKLVATTLALSAALLGVLGALSLTIGKLPFIIAGFQSLIAVLGMAKGAVLSLNTALKVGLVGAIAFALVEVAKLINVIYDWKKALNEAKQAQQRMADMNRKAFPVMVELFGKIKRSASDASTELKDQAVEIQRLLNEYLNFSATTPEELQKVANMEDYLTEKIKGFSQLYYKQTRVHSENVDARKAKKQEEHDQLVQLTEAEEGLFSKLYAEVLALDDKTYAAKLKNLELEKKEREKRMKSELKDKKKQVLYLAALDTWYTKSVMKLKQEEKLMKLEAAFSVADYSIQTAKEVLEMEGSSAKKKKALTIALITLEKGLAIARVWAAHASIPFAGTAIASAQTALIVAQWAAIMKGLTGATSSIDSSGATDFDTTTPATPPTVTEPTIETPDTETGEGGVTTGGGGTGGGTAISRVTHIDVGGVEVNIDTPRVDRENIEQTLRDIGEAVKSKTVEAVTMAMRIHNLGKENEGEAV